MNNDQNEEDSANSEEESASSEDGKIGSNNEDISKTQQPRCNGSGKSLSAALRFKTLSFRRMKPKDLKWPLRKSETMQLIEALERHKSTCTMALTENGLAGIHAVLEQTKFSNQCLENLKAKQEKLFELSINQE
ncbi:hypothetical protein MMC29_001259 [Sticta canariensis]|nr:hypothetical protein [Sticta canariensis]